MDDDFGHQAYLDIQAELGQWGDAAPASTPRYSPRNWRYDFTDTPSGKTTYSYPATPGRRAAEEQGNDYDDDGMNDVEEDDFSPSSSLRSPDARTARRGPAGVETPEPPQGHAATMAEEPDDDDDVIGEEDDYLETAEQPMFGENGTDPYCPYHDALLAFLRSREGLSSSRNDVSTMQIDGEEDDDDSGTPAPAEESSATDEIRYLASLAEICLSRSQTGEGDRILRDASRNEGNFWHLMAALRAGGLDSLFYRVDDREDETPPVLTLSGDPAAMVDIAPAEALDACMGVAADGGSGASLPLRRLIAALGWIEACHGREFDEALSRDCEGNTDPIVPPPRQRTMWPATLEEMKRGGRSSSGAFHPDAPLRAAFGGSASPVSVSSFLAPEDEAGDARLLRACLMLFRAGRVEEAMRLANDCGQPWRAASWTGGEPLSADGVGNPARAFWKGQCRKISKMMARLADAGASSMADSDGTRHLYPSVAYESAILSLLSDDVDAALNNPVFRTWEDGVHAVLRSELGIIEDEILMSHNRARVEAVEANRGHFPYPGTEFSSQEGGNVPRGNDGDLGAALKLLDASPIERVREGGGDPIRNGMVSFLTGQNAPKEYIEECSAMSLEADNDDEACFLRFVVHLVLFADAVLPDFSSGLALPAGTDATADGGVFSLRELLILKYVSHLASRRELWPLVALYTSLLSPGNILDTYSSFIIHVHSDRERRMVLKRARGLFPRGLDLYILRNVVRGMVLCERDNWVREPGEEPAPPGVAPADARMMRSIRWLCYHPEHGPDALVAANMLLRRFLLSCADDETDASDLDLHAPKVFIEEVLPKDLIDVAMYECEKESEAIAGSISLSLAQNLKLEFLSIDSFLKAHTKFLLFLGTISKTSPCHHSNKLVLRSQSEHEAEIADKVERNAFRQKKVGLCKIIIESSTRASDALMHVLTFGGGWLVDFNTDLDNEETETEEAKARSEELAAIRSEFVPRAVFMLQEVLDQTATWLEQIVYDTLTQFGSASADILLAIMSSFDQTYRSSDDMTMDLLTFSLAAPGYWHKKAVSLASVVANEVHSLHELFSNEDMERFLSLTAESHVKLQQSLQLGQTFFDD